jgi:tetratricopeptide (TPR) repeat protein
MRHLALVVGLLLLVNVVAAQEGGRPGQAAYYAAREEVKGLPLEQAVEVYQKQVVDAYPATEFAAQAVLNISTLYLIAKQYDRALEYADRALADYPTWYLAGHAIRRKCMIFIECLNQPQQALDLLDNEMPKYADVFQAPDLAWIPCYRYDAWVKLGDEKRGLEELDKAVTEVPQVLDQWPFMSRYIPALLAAKQTQKAESVAKGAFACCRVAERELAQMSELVVKSFLGSGEIAKATQFTEAQQDTTKPNPLADVPWPAAGSADKTAMMANCRGSNHTKIVVLLYLGAYNDAFVEATTRLESTPGQSQIATYMDDVSRCLKAKDLNSVRANAFILYATEGKGENPAASF